jgi:hypothetical protein
MDELARAVEAALFASDTPLTLSEIELYVGEGDIAAALRSLTERYEGHGIELVERVEKAGRLEVVDARQVAARSEAEVGQELRRGRIKQGPARRFPAAGGPDPACLHQHVERAPRDLDAADRLDLGAADRLVIGDDRQRLGRRAR